MVAAAVYLAAIVAANVSVSTFGPIVAPLNALLFVGLDLSLRDRLQDRYGLGPRMVALVLVGGALSWVASSPVVAVASTVAFLAATSVDALTYRALGDRAQLVRVNGSNVLAAAVDSVLFVALAGFGFDPVIVAMLWACKVGGGFLWSLVLFRPRARLAV